MLGLHGKAVLIHFQYSLFLISRFIRLLTDFISRTFKSGGFSVYAGFLGNLTEFKIKGRFSRRMQRYCVKRSRDNNTNIREGAINLDTKRMIGKERINIFLGEFGSGKTEFAVNYALFLQQAGINTAIVDIDLVKPYFRTRENRGILEKAGVKVVAPEDRLAQADLPIPPDALTQTLFDQDTHVVMDVGGGESAVVLGQIHRHLIKTGYEAFMVVNTRRPFTTNAAEIINTMNSIEYISRLKIGGFISNTNLAAETTEQEVLEGVTILRECAEKTGIPLKCVLVPEWLKDKLHTDIPQFILKPYTHYPWM